MTPNIAWLLDRVPDDSGILHPLLALALALLLHLAAAGLARSVEPRLRGRMAALGDAFDAALCLFGAADRHCRCVLAA